MCEGEGKWYLAEAWEYIGAWWELAGAEGQMVRLCKALRGPDASLHATESP